jgi:hypothetical protein
MKRYIPLFKEQIVGANTFVYHRTRNPKAVKNILKKGILTGDQGIYGTGLYSTYDLESQLNQIMEKSYGDIIIKFKINLQGYLILDQLEAKKVYSKNYKLQDQIRILNIKIIDKNIIEDIKFFDDSPPNITSNMAKTLVDAPEIKTKIKGLIFTSIQDGKVSVTYNLDSIIPVSYTTTNYIDPEKEKKTINRNYDASEWIRINSSGTLPDTRKKYPPVMYSRRAYSEDDSLWSMMVNDVYDNRYETTLYPKPPAKKNGYYIIEWGMERVSKTIDLFNHGMNAEINNDQYMTIEHFSYLIKGIQLGLPQRIIVSELGEEKVIFKNMKDVEDFLSDEENQPFLGIDDAKVILQKFRLKP